MQITLDVPAAIIANMMISAMESGDPVTTAARGGWCNGINIIDGGTKEALWYADPKLYDGNFVIEIIEVDDESTGHDMLLRFTHTHIQNLPVEFCHWALPPFDGE